MAELAAREYAELSQAIDGFDLNEAMRAGLDAALQGEASLEAELKPRFAEAMEELEKMHLSERISQAVDGLSFDEAVQAGLDLANKGRASMEAELKPRVAELIGELERLHLAEKVHAAMSQAIDGLNLDEAVQTGLSSLIESRASLEAELKPRIAAVIAQLERMHLAENVLDARAGLGGLSQTVGELLSDLVRELQRSLL